MSGVAAGRTGASVAELQALERDHLMPTYARLPVAFARGEGAWLYDAERDMKDAVFQTRVEEARHIPPRTLG